MSAPLRLGLVGCGKIARDQHIPAIAGMSGIELVAVADPNGAIAGPRYYPDIAALLAGEPDLDAVTLCQPPQARFAAARAALIAGKHVFLEKPPGATMGEVEALVELARARGLTLFAGWHSRYAAGVAPARHWLAERQATAIAIRWMEDVRVWHPGQHWIWQPGGFGVFDPGINALSILTAIVAGPIRLIDAELAVPANRAAPIAATLSLATAGGTPIRAAFDFRQTGPQSWDIDIEAGGETLRLSDGGHRLAIDGRAIVLPPGDEYPAMYADFLDMIAEGRSAVDLAPLRLVADAFLRGRACPTERFDD